MRDRPGGAELLWQAREVMLRELLQHLPEEKKYDGLMIGAAMATAARELEAGDSPLRRAHAELSEVYGDSAMQPSEAAQLEEELLQLFSRLAQDIRAGRMDADGRIHALLRELTIDKLRESNPKLLAARDIS